MVRLLRFLMIPTEYSHHINSVSRLVMIVCATNGKITLLAENYNKIKTSTSLFDTILLDYDLVCLDILKSCESAFAGIIYRGVL